MFRAFVTGFLRNDPPPPQEIDFHAYFWLFLDNIITDKEEAKPNSCSDS